VKGMRAVQKTVIDQLAAVVKAAPTAHPMSLLRTGVTMPSASPTRRTQSCASPSVSWRRSRR
jgi:hypothetical protein